MNIQMYVFWLTYVCISWSICGVHKIGIWSALVENGKEYSKEIWPIYTSTSSNWEFWLLHLQDLALSFILAVLIGVCWHHIMFLIGFLVFIPASHPLWSSLGISWSFHHPLPRGASQILSLGQMSWSIGKTMCFPIYHPLMEESLMQPLWTASEHTLPEESMPVYCVDYFVYLCLKIPTGTNTKLESKIPAITNDKFVVHTNLHCNKVIPNLALWFSHLYDC